MSAIPGNTSTTTVLGAGQSYINSITAVDDADWFRVALQAGYSYSFTVVSYGGPGIGLTGPDLGLYDTSGVQIDYDTSYSGSVSTISFQAGQTGVHFVGVADWSDDMTGQYKVSWVATDNVLANISTNRALLANGSVTSKLDVEGDSDWFSLSMVAGRSYGFELRGATTDPLVGSDMQLRDGDGNMIAFSTAYSGTLNTINFNPTASGGYFLSVNDGDNDTGTYTITWIATDGVQNNVSTGHSLVRNGTVASRLDVGSDADWFKFSMTEGLSYGFELRGATTDLLTGGDLQLRNAGGNILDSRQTYSGTANDLSFHATATGTYFVSVNDADHDVGGYSLRWVATDTIRHDVLTAHVLNRASVVSSAIDVVGDEDWFKVTMSEGMTYGFQVLSATSNPLQYGDLTLMDATGNVIASFNSYSGSTNTLAFTAATSGTYFVKVYDYDDDTGGYSLRNIGADVVRADVRTGSQLVSGGRLSGNIEMISDSDWHKIETQQGVAYTFSLSGDGTATELDSVMLVLRDREGNVVRTEYGLSGSASITHTATSSGPLFLEVKGYYSSSDQGTYVLTAVSNAPTLTGTSAADRLQGGAGATVMNGGLGNDWMDGGLGNDRLFGSAGNDVLYGNADHDTIYGGLGDDRLNGGSGNDVLEGEAGNDVLAGGLGYDRFVFRTTANSDTITDYQDGYDRIQIIGGPTSIAGLTFTTVGEDVRISFGTVRILIEDITRAELTSADFIFS